MQLAFELVEFVVVERLDREERVDEEAIAARRRYAARGRVWARDETHFLEVRHYVADARGREVETRHPRQRARAHRLAVGDVALDQRLEQRLRAFVKRGRIGRHR